MSRLPFEIFLALRYLRPKRTFVSVITLISVIGVMLGVAVLIIVISVMSGFDQQLREKILGFNAHLKIFLPETTLKNYEATLSLVASNKEVRGVAPYVFGQVMIETQPAAGNSMVGAPWLRGIEPRWETNVSFLHTNVPIGEFNLEGSSVLVGIDIARALNLHVGDRILIDSPSKLKEMRDRLEKGEKIARLRDDFEVRGIFDVGYYEFNSTVIVTSLENAQELYRLDGAVHGLLVMLHDPFKAPQVRRELQPLLGADYEISLWSEDSSKILDALLVEKNVMFYILVVIMVVAGFCIMNTQITFVVQKTREIGMVKALGATRAQLVWLFLAQSTVVSVVGVLSGLGVGRLMVAYRNEFLRFMNRLTGFELFPAQIYNFYELPALIVPRDIALICVVALAICTLAGIVPAWVAARLKPVEALRHE